MYSFWAFICGVILAVMIQMNGGLSAEFGVYHGALYIHIVGVVFAGIVLAVKRERLILRQKLPLWIYAGGVIGVLTTVFNNLAFSHISITGIVALGLFAQLAFSCLIDRFGWFGMEKHKRRDLSIPGIACSVAGIALMLEDQTTGQWGYILISLGAGVTVVLSRIVNAHLSNRKGALQGSLINHLVGLPVCLLLALSVPEVSVSTHFRPWIWCGGILGVITVAICNVIVPKIPEYRLTLFTMCGQLFSGVLLDVFNGNALNRRQFGAALLVAAGIGVSRLSKLFSKTPDSGRSRSLQ